MEILWLKGALFTGMTANAFKLGTVLTLGWFWLRVTGCSVLYRGSSMEGIDFANILAVAETNACEISPPSYMQHNNSSIYFYVVRQVNNCGEQEYTLAAAVKVAIDVDGELAQPQPNSIFEVRGKQVASNKIQLTWFYCPIDQKSEPVRFKIYYDAGTGQIDYENSIATITYAGRIFYNYQSDTLNADRYLFAIKAEDNDGTENTSLDRISIQLNATSPDAIDILSAEAI